MILSIRRSSIRKLGQQTTLNELSGLVMKLIANGLPSCSDSGDKEYNYDSTTLDIGESVYTPHVGKYSEQDMTESNYVCDPVDGVCSISIDNLEEVKETEMDEDENGEHEGEGEGEGEHEVGHEVQ